jgi:hypothetical protein
VTTPRQLAQDVENAFDFRGREMMTRPLAMLVALATPPDFSRLTIEQLEERRSQLLDATKDVNDRLVAMQQAGRRTSQLQRLLLEPLQADSLEPSY